MRIIIAMAVVAVLAIALSGWEIHTLSLANESLSGELSQTQAAYASSTLALADLQKKYDLVKTERDVIAQNIENQQNVISTISQQVNTITGAVSTIGKYATTDKELLAKYSKTYFLNENYSPAHLTQIPVDYTVRPTKDEWFLTDAWPFLQRLLDDAKAAGSHGLVLSAYRSFDTQNQLKAEYKVTYGSGANQFSADQGYSEHQLGTAVDFSTSAGGDNLDVFKDSTMYNWLLNNAYKYGFEMSYPSGNGYYVFEPWHWRFIGVALATKLHNSGQNFYDLDQREIDTYLSTLFTPIP